MLASICEFEANTAEGRRKSEARMPRHATIDSHFAIRISFGFRHSRFVIEVACVVRNSQNYLVALALLSVLIGCVLEVVLGFGVVSVPVVPGPVLSEFVLPVAPFFIADFLALGREPTSNLPCFSRSSFGISSETTSLSFKPDWISA